MDKGFGFALVPIFVIVFLAFGAQAAAPVSPPDSRFVWEPGENLTFTWTNENFDGFYYDAQTRTGKESLTIKLNKIEDRSIPDGGIVYSTKVETTTARYRPFGEYAVIWFMGGKYLTGFPEGKSNISAWSGINLNRLQYILIDDDTSYALIEGSNLTLDGSYVLEVRDVDAAGSRVTLSLMREGIGIDTKTVDTGKNYIYEIRGRPVIAVHIDSILKENETVSVAINGIFQASEQYTPVNDGDIFGRMKITKVSDTGITMSNFLPVDLKRGSIIDIGDLELKVADSNTLRVHLYKKWLYVKDEHRGATGSNNLTAWDGLNYAGFSYDADSGNYSESLVITNLTGREIPEGGLTYISYRLRKVPYTVTNITGIKPEGTDGSYAAFSLGGKKYTPRNNGFRELLIAHGDSISEKKVLLGKPPWFEGDDKLAPGLDTFKWGMDTWELGE
ncbi:MAG: S-layer protein domain-containing protein, partial [Candidatus Methanoperedens sp.]|nr:S-layer protein domain-containing protein [Candidatus Methanoperedens sp.]